MFGVEFMPGTPKTVRKSDGAKKTNEKERGIKMHLSESDFWSIGIWHTPPPPHTCNEIMAYHFRIAD